MLNHKVHKLGKKKKISDSNIHVNFIQLYWLCCSNKAFFKIKFRSKVA